MIPSKPLSLPRAEYEAIDAIHWSTLKLMGKSPAHYLHALQPVEHEDTDARQRGRVLHMAIFEPHRLAAEVVVYPDRRAGKDWQAFALANQGKEIITTKMNETVQGLRASARSSPLAMKYLQGGRSEQTLRWKHVTPAIGDFPAVEFDCKGRVDFLADCGAMVDLKVTRDASPAGFGREVMRYDYHGQAAFYGDGYERMTGQRLPFVIVAVEAVAPFVVQVYRVTDEQLELGRDLYLKHLAHLDVCRRESKWPGYAETEMELHLPRWAYPSEDENAEGFDLIIGGSEAA
jgi:hypothetical protein